MKILYALWEKGLIEFGNTLKVVLYYYLAKVITRSSIYRYQKSRCQILRF